MEKNNYINNTNEEALFTPDYFINADDKFYLSDIITDKLYNKWFARTKPAKIFVLNKGRCGNGGTMGFINYAREQCKGLIVSVPNRSIVISKEKYDECCCVYGGAENIDRNKNIRICTWDKADEVEGYNQFGFENIDVIDWDVDPRIWSGSLLVVDEYHKLIDDSNYREICYKITEKILTTDSNVVLMSATPNYEFIEFLRLYSGKDVETYSVQYDDEDKDKVLAPIQWMDRPKGVRLYDIVSEVIEASRRRKNEYMECPSKVGLADSQVCIFFSSVREISNLVNDMPDTSDVEVLCAKTELNELRVPCYSKKFNPEKQIHFLTSAYFVGMDIYLPKDERGHKRRVDKFIFIGGNSQYQLSYSNKEIKQGLGRGRDGYNGSFIIPDGRIINGDMYKVFAAKREESIGDVKKYKDFAGDEEYVQRHLEAIIKCNLDNLYYTKIIESMEGWNDGASFKNMMSVYPEYTVNIKEMPKPKIYKRKRDISFNEYKKKRLAGEEVVYKYSGICEKYIEKYGLDKFETATRSEIERKVKLDFVVGDVDIETMTGEQKFEFLLGDGYYSGSYLMGVLDYLGEKCEYEELEEKMNGVFGCYCIYQKGNRTKGSSVFLCLLTGSLWQEQKNWDTPYIYKNASQKNGYHHINALKISRRTSKFGYKTEAITEYLDSSKFYSMINGGDYNFQAELYTKIFKDVSVIPTLKREEQYKKILDECKNNQTLICEFYKDTPSSTRYPHKAEEMEKIDCLIVDIDDSISFNEFYEKYSHLTWTAYPTISNYDADNWRKFRVVFPLAQTLLIPNDSLNVLKLLRRMVCKYEDKCHNLGSNINAEQWEMRRSNEGKVVDISQGTVIYLHSLLQNMVIISGKFRKSKKDNVVVDIQENTNAAIERAVQLIQDAKEGSRHSTIFGQMWKLMFIYHISDEQINYIRKRITDNEKVKEFNEQVKYIYKRYMR